MQPIAGVRLRAVFARLAIDVGRPVPVDRLVTDVWGDRRPVDGANAVAYQVKKLRDLLEPDRRGTGSLVRTTAAGYSLDVDPAEIDLHRFVELVEHALDPTNGPLQSQASSHAALALWRGDPFADVADTVVFEEQARRLEDLHLAARCADLRARIELGDPSSAAPELAALVEQHPLQESLVGDLMRALWHADRPVAALRAYGELRVRLSAELGIEPSSDLQRMESQLLASDAPPEVEPKRRRAGAPPPIDTAMLGNVPPAHRRFFGRAHELEVIEEALAKSGVVVLTGPGGAGKSRLLIEFARRSMGEYPDGRWQVDLSTVDGSDRVMSQIAHVLGVRAAEGAAIDDVLVRHLRQRSLLLLLDNCEHVVSAASAAISAIRQYPAGVHVVATSRESLGLPDEVVVPVPPLSLPTDADEQLSDSLALFLDRGLEARGDVPLDHEELAAAKRICRRLDGLPLAIELAAARLRLLGVGELDRRLQDSFHVLGGSAKGLPERHRTLSSAVAWSYELLEGDEAALFRRLSLVRGPFDVDLAEAIGEAEGGRSVVELLDALVDRSLVSVQAGAGPPRLRLLEPIRQFGAEQLDAGERAEALRRHAAHMEARIAALAPKLRGPAQQQAVAELEFFLAHVRRALLTLMAPATFDRFLDTTFHLLFFWRIANHRDDAIRILKQGLSTAPPAADEQRLARAWFSLALLEFDVSDRAALDHAAIGLDIASAHGDDRTRGWLHLLTAGVVQAGWNADPNTAAEHLEQGRRLLNSATEPSWWDDGWERGLHYAMCGAFCPRGMDADDLASAIAIFDRLGDGAMLAECLADAAFFLSEARPAEATANAHRAAEIYQALGSELGEGHARQQLGRLLLRAGDRGGAADQFDLARALLERGGDLSCWAVSTRLLAVADEAVDVRSASALLQQVIDIGDELPIPEMHVPELFDATAIVLARGAEAEAAAVVLGHTETMAVPFDTGVDRAALHEEADHLVTNALGRNLTEQLKVRGRASTSAVVNALARERLALIRSGI